MDFLFWISHQTLDDEVGYILKGPPSLLAQHVQLLWASPKAGTNIWILLPDSSL